MSELINQIKSEMQDLSCPWYLCGGYGLDVFMKRKTRKHKDIDITVDFMYADTVIQYMKTKGYTIWAPVGKGKLTEINDAKENDLYFDNIWCLKGNLSRIKVLKDEEPFFYVELDDVEQLKLDFVEVMFNFIENDFVYLKNNKIKLKKEKSYFESDGMQVLSPEITLLYKSRAANNLTYKNDFINCYPQLSSEARDWLMKSMKDEYATGHSWFAYIE